MKTHAFFPTTSKEPPRTLDVGQGHTFEPGDYLKVHQGNQEYITVRVIKVRGTTITLGRWRWWHEFFYHIRRLWKYAFR